MKQIQLVPVLAILAACGSPAVCGGCGADGGLPDGELPSAFRIEAEVVSVEPGGGLTERQANCSPNSGDIDANGPDWLLEFWRVHDAVEPTFRGVAASSDDDAESCQNWTDPNGVPWDDDCCRPLSIVDGGWVLDCDGVLFTEGGHRYRFTFRDDGSGEATVTANSETRGVICTSTVEWTDIVPSTSRGI